MNILVPSEKSIVSYQGIQTVFLPSEFKKNLYFILSDNETLDTITYIHANFLENVTNLPLKGIVPNRH